MLSFTMYRPGSCLQILPKSSSPYMAFPDCCDTQGHFIEAIVNKEFYDEHVESGFPRADAEFEKHLEDGMALLIYKMKK